jgi:hypothetical protein
MGSNAIRTGFLAEERGSDRVGFISLPRFAHRGNVIDVDVEPHCSPLQSPLSWLPNL